MEVYKLTTDKIYPYVIEDDWGDALHLTKEDLQKLHKDIGKILKQERKIENEKE